MRSFLNLLLALPAVLAAPVLDTRAIPDSWIVTVKKDAALTDVLSQVSLLTNKQATHKYSIGDFQGFSLDGVSGLTSILANVANIHSIEPNTKVYASALVTQTNPPYGLARISKRDRPATNYIYDSSAGAGTYSYIIDTGIYTNHVDFEGRAVPGAYFIENDSVDRNGHGTHVSGTTGSKTYGVAKKTNLIAVKVLGADGSGSNAGVLAGIDWAVKDAKSKGRIGKAVGNLSLGGTFSQSTNDAVAAAVREGLFLAVAAGNSAVNANTASPASEPTVCTVGATDSADKIASFSNYGTGVDILAPGVDVLSTWIGSPTATNTISGTSMASPHIAGLGAYLLGLEGAMTPAQLTARIVDLSSKDKIALGLVAGTLGGTPNRLAYNGNGA